MRIFFPSLIFTLVCLFGSPLCAQDTEAPTDRYTVYDTYDELEAHLNTYSEQILVVNFWATYCIPCIKEVPYFSTLQEKYASKNVKVVMVNLDFKSQLNTRLDKFLDTNPLKLEIAVLADQDADTWVPKVAPDWDGALPFTLILHKGNIKNTHREAFPNYEELEKFVTPYLPIKPSLASKRRK
jgi:thiol-disulfide isomerase/thioredoxin